MNDYCLWINYEEMCEVCHKMFYFTHNYNNIKTLASLDGE